MDIKVTIGLDERTHKLLNRLISALANHSPIGPGKATEPDDEEWTEEEKRAVLQEIAEEEAADAARRGLSPANPAPAQVSADGTADAAEGKSGGNSEQKKQKPKITIEELRALAADVKAKTGSVDKVKALLNAYSAKNISALPADKWDEFAAKLKELL